MHLLKSLFSLTAAILFFSFTNAQRVMVEGTPTMKDDYPKKIGNLRLSVNFIALRKVKTNEVKTDSIKIMNTWDKKMTLSFQYVPAYLMMKATPSELEPGATGMIVCSFDGSKRNNYGYFIDKVQLNTNDTVIPKKMISVTATVEEYFPPMTAEDSGAAPRIKFSEEKVNLGKVKSGDKKDHDFIISNEGKKPLTIHTAKSSSANAIVHLEKNLLQPGETAKLSLNYSSPETPGNDNKTIIVISSDPFRPVVSLNIECEIEK